MVERTTTCPKCGRGTLAGVPTVRSVGKTCIKVNVKFPGLRVEKDGVSGSRFSSRWWGPVFGLCGGVSLVMPM